MSNLLRIRTIKSGVLALALLASARICSAQAMVGADRGSEIVPFGYVSILSTDWGPYHNYGYTVGVDYTRFIRSIVQPSLEFRYNSANGKTVSEHSYEGGLKLQTTIRGFHPYATILYGHGDIKFNYYIPGYSGDASGIYAFGGGADFNLGPQWKVRLDYSRQHWNLDPNTLTPSTLGVGVAYTVPFHSGRPH